MAQIEKRRNALKAAGKIDDAEKEEPNAN